VWLEFKQVARQIKATYSQENWIKDDQRFFISCALDFEPILAQEIQFWLKKLAPKLKPDLSLWSGGIELSLPLGTGFLLNHCLKTANRILWRIEQFKCTHFVDFEKRLVQIPWNYFCGQDTPKFKVESHGSRLFHKKNLEQSALQAFERYRAAQPARKKLPMQSPTIFIRFDQDQCTISVDTSGDHLHKRGYKTQTTAAPLRETLAAGLLLKMLNSCSPSPQSVNLVDPMCGSGTFLGEAYFLYKPLFFRPFAFDSFFICKQIPNFGKRILKELEVPLSPFKNLVGIDLDPKSIKAAETNLASIPETDLFNEDGLEYKLPHTEENLWLITNPPYNARLKRSPQTKNNEQLIEALRKNYQPSHMGLIVTSDSSQGKGVLSFKNSGIPVEFLMFSDK
tara:strand:- start:35016 stop:36200 length:1185 start_codon:yes stop_codon:yes gene_type:complete